MRLDAHPDLEHQRPGAVGVFCYVPPDFLSLDSGSVTKLKSLCAQLPTLANIKLRYGSLKGWFKHHGADIVCFQVCGLVKLSG